jgi:primosomal protein N'
LQTSLAQKRKELNNKNEEANLKLKQMVHDQQEAEKKRISSQELQVVLAVGRKYLSIVDKRSFECFLLCRSLSGTTNTNCRKT